MQRFIQEKTYYAHTGIKKSKLRQKYNQSSFDIEHTDSALQSQPATLKESKTPMDQPQYFVMQQNDNKRNPPTNYQSYDKSIKRAKMNAFIELHSPKKVMNTSQRKISSQMSPSHAQYKTPLYNIVLDESDSAVKQKRPSAQEIQQQDYMRDLSHTSQPKSSVSTYRQRHLKVLNNSQMSQRVGLRTNPVSNENSISQLPDLHRAKLLKDKANNAHNIKNNNKSGINYQQFLNKNTNYMDKHHFGNTGDIQTKMTTTKLNKKRIKSSGKITVSGVTQSVTSFNGQQQNNAYNEEMQMRQQQNDLQINEQFGYSSNAPSHVKAQTVYNHQRIQSNPVFLNEFNQMLANSQNQQLRMTKQQQHINIGGHSNTVSIPSSAGKKLSQEKRNSNSQKPQPGVQKRQVTGPMNHPHDPNMMHDQGHPQNMQQYNQQMGNEPISHYSQSASMNQSNSGLNKAFSKVLNTLNNDHMNFSRQEAVGNQVNNVAPPKKSMNLIMQQPKVSSIAGAPHHQKALSMSSYMMQPKNMSFTQQQSSKRGQGQTQHTGMSNQGAGGTVHVQPQGITIQSSKINKKKPINSQQMTFVNDGTTHHVKTVMVPSSHQGGHQNRLDLFNQPGSGNSNQIPVSKTQHQNSSNTLGMGKNTQGSSINQKFQKTSLHISQLGKMGRGVKTSTKQTLSKNIITHKQQTSPRNSINISASISPQIKSTVGQKTAQIGRSQNSMMGQTQMQSTNTTQQNKLASGHHRRQVTLQYEPSSQIQGQIMTQNAASFQSSALKNTQQSVNQNSIKPRTGQRSNISSANGPQQQTGNHRRIRSDQVSMTKKSLNQHYLDQQQQQNPDNSQDMDQIANSGRIVVINNNNTNINIHHPQGFHQGSHQFTHDNIQSLQESYNLAQINNQMVNGIQPIKAQTQHNSTLRTNSINLSQKNGNSGIQSVPNGYTQQMDQQQPKNINQQINQMNHQRLQSMDLDEQMSGNQQNHQFIVQHQNQVTSQKNQKRKIMQNQQQAKHMKKISGGAEHFKATSNDMMQVANPTKHHQSKSLMQNLNLVTQKHMIQQQQDLDHSIGPSTSDNHGIHDAFSHQHENTANRSQTRGDSGTVKRTIYNKTNTVKRGTSGNTKKNSIRQGASANLNSVGNSVISSGINNFMHQQTNQSSKGNMRRTIKNPQTSGKQLMNHLKQNQGDKPSTLLNSDRSTKLGNTQNQHMNNNHSGVNNHHGQEEVMGYQSSSATQMQSMNQYRSGAMHGGHIPITQQQVFKNMAVTHGGKFQNQHPTNMKQMSAHNLHALNNNHNNSDNQSQSQFEHFQNNQYNNSNKPSGHQRQRQNNYMNSQERPEMNANKIPEVSTTKHKKVNSGQFSNSQMKLYQIMSNQQIQQNNNYMIPGKANHEAMNSQTPEKFQQQSHQYMHLDSQKVSKETVLTDSQKYKIGAGKNPNFQSFQRQKSHYKDESSSMNRSPRDSNQQSPFHSKGGSLYYPNQPGGGHSGAYGQIIDGAKRYNETNNSPTGPGQKLSTKDQNLQKVQTKNRYAQSELLKKANNQQKQIRTDVSQNNDQEFSKQGSKMRQKNESIQSEERPKKVPGIIAKAKAGGGQLTPRKLILNNILSNIANKTHETKIDYYKIGKVIGKGAFGKVNLAINRLTGKFVALKSINKTYMTDESSLKKIMQEYNILKRARHQNIVRLYESFDTDSHTVYVMEVCGGGDLLTYVRRRRKLKEDLAKHVFRQLIQGLMYVNSKRVLHRDIKLDNILLTSEGDVKICDFGVSKLVQSKNQIQHEQCGTPAYIAPEVFKGKGYRGFQSDVWSAGVVLYAMLFGTVPFKATNMGELQQQIINVQCSWGSPGDISDGALSILKKILEADPLKRLTPQQILIDPWMQLTEAQISKIEVFTQHEKEKIVSDFQYYNQKKEDGKGAGDDPFLEQKLQSTQNSIIKNNTTKSVILAPFNSTKSHISDNFFKRDSIQDLLVPNSVLVFANKCKEINRQYMLNNNAELDNGVYNENEEKDAIQPQNSPRDDKDMPDDGLMGLNMQIENKGPGMLGGQTGNDILPSSQIESNATSNLHSLNTSQIVVDTEKAQQLEDLYGYDYDYIIESVENEELNHCTTVYYLIDQEKEF